jgi:histidinol-phosphatase (PHP family)
VKKVNYHTHTTGSDGKLKPEELIELAIKRRFDILGITDHYFIPGGFREPDNEMYSYYDEEHYEELCRLRGKYKDELKVLVNVEFDWLGDYVKWMEREATKRDYDLRYISVHYIKTSKEHIPLDWKEEAFVEMIEDFGNVEKLVRWYYASLRDAVRLGCFDVVSHFDLIKIWNRDEKYFNEIEDWYREEVLESLRLIAEKGMKLDLNSSGLRKPCGEQYPSLWIINEAKKMGICFLVGTDAHNEGELEMGLDVLEGFG